MMMRDGKYKYVRYLKAGVLEEIYDLDKDPEELNNLAVNPEFAPLLERLRSKAVDEFHKKDGDFVDYLPPPGVQGQPDESGNSAAPPTTGKKSKKKQK
jgi:arylsulfatase A-like enzyme